jgi:putative membrane protein
MVMTIPKWLKCFADEKNLKEIEDAVKNAEIKTSCEIVPMVVRRSSGMGHVVPLLVMALALLVPYWHFMTFSLFWVLTGIGTVIGIIVVANLLASIPAVQRFFTSDDDMDRQTNLRAEVEFFENNLHHTAGRTGILLMLSLAERRAVVLADESIAKKLPPETWNEVISLMIQGIKSEHIGKGFVNAIEKCSAILAAHFPAERTNPDELKNQLIIKDA